MAAMRQWIDAGIILIESADIQEWKEESNIQPDTNSWTTPTPRLVHFRDIHYNNNLH
jgi:hypothetical protein